MLTIIELLVIVGVLVFIGYPLFRRGEVEFIVSDIDNKKAELLHKKEYVYLSIKDLEEDYLASKVSEEDYHELKKRYESEAINILKELDGKSSREKSKKKAPSAEQKGIFCRKCGKEMNTGDKFCFSCGAKIST